MIDIIKQHKRVVIVSLLLLCLTIGVSLAVFSDKTDTLKNTFTLGKIETDINETEEVTPKSENLISKTPTITNDEDNSPALIRVRITLSPSDIVGKYNIATDINGDWIYNEEDGFYYYKNILEPGTSVKVFENVTGHNICYTNQDNQLVINEELDGLEIAIYHESVQTMIVGSDGNQIIAKDGEINPKDFESTDAGKIWSYFKSQD